MDPTELANVVRRLCPTVDLSESSLLACGKLVKETLQAVVKNARTLARHRNSLEINSDDINQALGLFGHEPVYGSRRFVDQRLASLDGKEVFFAESSDVSVAEVNNVNLKTAPSELQIHSHWLAIEGTQPRVPENEPAPTSRSQKVKSQRTMPSKDAPSRKRKNHVETVQNVSGGMVQGGIELRLPVEHALTTEQQAYFEQIQQHLEPIAQSSSPDAGHDAESIEKAEKKIQDLQNDAALQPLVPYLIQFAARHVYSSMHDVQIVMRTLRVLHSLVRNKHLDLGLYSHHILPLILTCLLSENLGDGDVHHLGEATKVRDEAAVVLACAVEAFDDAISNLQVRISQRLADALDPESPSIVKYGAIRGLDALGMTKIEGLQNILKLCYNQIDEQLTEQESTGLIYQQGRVCQALVEEIMTRIQKQIPESEAGPSPLTKKARREDTFI